MDKEGGGSSWIFIGESKLLELELSETRYQKKEK